MGFRGTMPTQALSQRTSQPAMNLADPELELIDPTPNVHAMFVQFDTIFFWSKLICRTTVKWSKRMYSCAGVCSFNGQQCDLKLSEPLLKLRPRKDLVETLLHEMIHAYCFVTNTDDSSRDGHGPNFQAHMHRINRAAGLNITIYHDFHEEVELYQTHWWRCNGVCQSKKPYFGIVRRSVNKPPGPSDYWWRTHQAMCGGTFTKIKEPEKKTGKKNSTNGNTSKSKVTNKPGKVNTTKSVNDITKYVNVTTTKSNNNEPVIPRPALKDSNINTLGSITNTMPLVSPTLFKGQGQRVSSGSIEKYVDAADAVRKAWANKTINNNNNTSVSKNNTSVAKKHKATDHIDSTPTKTRKIDDYFPAANAILKDLYGDNVTLSKKDNSLLVSVSKPELVDCPVCKAKISSEKINTHLDECLNKGIIESLSDENVPTASSSQAMIKTETEKNKEVVNIKIEPGTSKEPEEIARKCPCCGELVCKPMEEHLDECKAFFDNTTSPDEGASTGFINETIVIDDDDDDDLNESAIFNATGTKYPCPCCMEMVEAAEMNSHLDTCLC